MNQSRNNGSPPSSFWRNTISRMRLTDGQVLVCWKVPGWESEGPSWAPLKEGGVVLGWSLPHGPGWVQKGVAEGWPGESTGFGVKGTGLHLGSFSHHPRDPIHTSVYPTAKQG